LMALSPLATHAKLAELERVGPRETVVRRYRDTAEEVLAGYEDWS